MTRRPQGNLYEPTEEIPCPMCHPRKAVEFWTQRNLSAGKPEFLDMRKLTHIYRNFYTGAVLQFALTHWRQ